MSSTSILQSHALAVDELWLSSCGALLLLGRVGLALVECGSIANKNVKLTISKNFLEVSLCTAAFWAYGFALAFGGDGNSEWMGGNTYFAGDCIGSSVTESCSSSGGAGGALGPTYARWFFECALLLVATAAVTGAIAERATTACSLSAAFLFASVVYPGVAYLQWSGNGYTNNTGDADGSYAIDHAGGAVVHVASGAAALAGAIFVGPRRDRFSGRPLNVQVHNMPRHSPSFVSVGALLALMGSLGAVGRTASVVGAEPQQVITLALVNLTLGACAGGIALPLWRGTVGVALARCQQRRAMARSGGVGFFDNPSTGGGIGGAHNTMHVAGALAGLAAISAGCADVRPRSAVAIGGAGGLIAYWAAGALHMLKIDDAIDASPVHLFAGAWGVVAVGIFGEGRGILSGETTLLGNQLALLIAAVLLPCIVMIPFYALFRVAGLARVPRQVEDRGLDESNHEVSFTKD